MRSADDDDDDDNNRPLQPAKSTVAMASVWWRSDLTQSDAVCRLVESSLWLQLLLCLLTNATRPRCLFLVAAHPFFGFSSSGGNGGRLLGDTISQEWKREEEKEQSQQPQWRPQWRLYFVHDSHRNLIPITVYRQMRLMKRAPETLTPSIYSLAFI